MNLKVARRGYDMASEHAVVPERDSTPLPIVSGNEAIGLGLLDGGLDAFVAYPMTPTSNLLHFLAEIAEEAGILVFHPENEIAVMLMALGLGYAGKKTAVGTSGGGFCLMTEGLSLSGMNEVPVVIVLGQRAGPSTGMPTYTAQSDLNFALHAGQGEFPRLVVAPGIPSRHSPGVPLPSGSPGGTRYPQSSSATRHSARGTPASPCLWEAFHT